jgi:hypothetical protein
VSSPIRCRPRPGANSWRSGPLTAS